MCGAAGIGGQFRIKTGKYMVVPGIALPLGRPGSDPESESAPVRSIARTLLERLCSLRIPLGPPAKATISNRTTICDVRHTPLFFIEIPPVDAGP
jgi:hypothetical protein